MDTNRVMQQAERVALLRLELKTEEAKLAGLIGAPPRPAPAAPRQSRSTGPAVPTSQRLRDLMKDSRKPLEWGEIVQLLGGPEANGAARQAMKSLRRAGSVKLDNGKYSWIAK